MRLCFTFQTILIQREVRRTAHKKKRVKKKSDQTKCSQLYRETVKVVSTDEVRRVIKACHDEGSTSGVTKPIRKWPEGTIGQE